MEENGKKSDRRDNGERGSSRGTAKKVYHSPRLVKYGDLKRLTRMKGAGGLGVSKL